MLTVPGPIQNELTPSAWLRFLTLTIASACCLTACTHKLAPVAHYQETPVVADGNPDDWSLPLRFANADYTLQYNITNDNRNIYICIISRNDPTIIRMLRAGITLYFDPKGQTDRGISLHYPLRKPPEPAVRDRDQEPLVAAIDSGWKAELLRQSDAYGTTGFIGIDNGQFGVKDNKSPIRVRMHLNNHDSLLVYEAIVPIANLLGPGGYGNRPQKKAFSIGVVLNTPSGLRNLENSRHRGGRGLGLGMNGLHMGGGHRNNGNDGNNPPVREDASWYQFRFAVR